ncbi:MAG TPA: hypothetical protein VG893_07765 [Terracidiphilus sp.]|nr:hypothetical protein [Terracidiphilus sp.]
MSDQTPSTANSKLTENVAGALAYITVIPAIVFLLIEPYNRNPYVRFHAWQCVFLFIAWIALSIVVVVSVYVLHMFAWMMFAFYPLLELAMIVLLIVLLIKTLNGQTLKLPIVGDLAEKQANS